MCEKCVPYDLNKEVEEKVLPLLHEAHRIAKEIGVPLLASVASGFTGEQYHIRGSVHLPDFKTPEHFRVVDLILRDDEFFHKLMEAYETVNNPLQQILDHLIKTGKGIKPSPAEEFLQSIAADKTKH